MITDEVPGGAPAATRAALQAGLARMGMPGLEIVATDDFVATVRRLTGEAAYHDDRNGGDVAARTVGVSGGGSVVVANAGVLSRLSDLQVERVAAHEAGHASIESRGESPWDQVGGGFPDHYWNFQVAYGAAVAVDEFRCEASAYRAGYPTGEGRADDDVASDLFGLNLQLLEAAHEYQEHLDVARLREDALKVVLFHLRQMGTVAARHLHGDPFDPTVLNQFARANWEVLVAPTWGRFLDVYKKVPEAFSSWPNPASADAALELVGVARDLVLSFGYEATEYEFWIRMTDPDRQARLDRANGEADLLGI